MVSMFMGVRFFGMPLFLFTLKKNCFLDQENRIKFVIVKYYFYFCVD